MPFWSNAVNRGFNDGVEQLTIMMRMTVPVSNLATTELRPSQKTAGNKTTVATASRRKTVSCRQARNPAMEYLRACQTRFNTMRAFWGLLIVVGFSMPIIVLQLGGTAWDAVWDRHQGLGLLIRASRFGLSGAFQLIRHVPAMASCQNCFSG